MKKLITHINPHLDDIAAIWLIKKFIPGFADAEINFISANEGKDGLKETEDLLYIGVGLGKYDEHKDATKNESAMSLVWIDIKSRNLNTKEKYENLAIDEMVSWNTLIDTAKMPLGEFHSFEVEAFIRSKEGTKEDSLKTIDLGIEILNRILPVLVKKYKSLDTWKERVEFSSKWGKTVAVDSEDFDRDIADKNKVELLLKRNPKSGFVGFTSPGISNTDLTEIYEKLKSLDPEAEWFLHQGKKMVLCGADSAPNAKKTKLNFSELIDVIKSLS